MALDINDDVDEFFSAIEGGAKPSAAVKRGVIDTLESLRDGVVDLYRGDAEDPLEDPDVKKKMKVFEDAIKMVQDIPTARSASLRERVIRLAHTNPALRPHLLPILKG